MDQATWILVTDAGRGRLFERMDGQTREVDAFVHPEAVGRRRPPRSAPAGRRGMGAGPSASLGAAGEAKEASAESFARWEAGHLKAGLDHHRYGALMLVAPPRFLGRLLAALDPQVAKRVVATLGRDYTRWPAAALMARLEGPHVVAP